MSFHSILFPGLEVSPPGESVRPPDCLVDLNLDQVIDEITSGRHEQQLKPFYYTPLKDTDTILYRQEVAQDLENNTLLEDIRTFTVEMSAMRRCLALADKSDIKYHKAGWFLEAVDGYCEAVQRLVQDITAVEIKSRGLLAFREFLKGYSLSVGFTRLTAETKKLRAELSTVKYLLLLKDTSVKVRRFETETDYSAEVEKTFEKFKQSSVKDYRVKLYIAPGMSPVEGRILEAVARLYPDIFSHLSLYCKHHHHFRDETLLKFDQEIYFYIAYFDYIARLKKAGMKFCYPQIAEDSKDIYSIEGFDLALANQCVQENQPVVWNDFTLKDKERIFIISGPNQGGKTTFARMVGQLHYLACLGCPVPGRAGRFFLIDQIFTHFETEEDIRTLRGKLQDDLVRIHSILEQATHRSLVIMNEIFTSTSLADAYFLSRQILARIIQMDALCICVTFIDELANLSDTIVSLVSTVDSENPAVRTYKVLRRPADGISHARTIAEKHRLTYQAIKERILP